MNELKDKNILITGATSGIGRSLALQLANSGARLALCGRSQEKMDSLLVEIAGGKNHHYSETFDITEESRGIDFVKNSTAYLGQIDILINNAGANTAKDRIADIKTSDLEWMIKLNLVAPFVFMREVYRDMELRKEGQIVNILSSTCLFSNETLGSYSASKSGLDAMTKIFRKEARAHNVKVFAVYPGGVNTPFRSNERPDYLSPDTVAEAIISLLKFGGVTSIHELVMRPMTESNF